MSADYWLGLATLPAVALALFVLYQLVETPGKVHHYCGKCGRKWYPLRFEPRWVYALRHRFAWRRHMRDSRPCRDYTNRWRWRHGDGGKWFA